MLYLRILILVFLCLPTLVFAQVGIGTETPTHYLSLGGNSSRTIGLERHSTSGSSGSSLTLLAGGAASTGSNLNGGNLILSSGITKGTGSSNIIFRTYPSGASGSADNSVAERMRITSSGNVLIGIDAETTGSKLAVKGILGILSPDNDLMAISNQTGQYFNIQTYSSKPLYINQLGNDVILNGSDGKVGIGTTTPESSAKLEIASTTQGFLPPRMTTTQRDAITSPADGLIIYNTTNNRLEIRSSSAWLTLVTLTGTETLTNKTLTSPTLTTPIISSTDNSSSAGALRYNTSSGGILQYSNGTSWNNLQSNVQKATVVAKKISAQSVSNTTITDVTNWDEITDLTNNFNPTTGIFTAPRTGNYVVSFSFNFNYGTINAGTVVEAQLISSGGTTNDKKSVVSYPTSGSAPAGAAITFTIKLTSGETVKPVIYHSLGVTKTLRVGTGTEDGFVNFSVAEL
jgi:hypothetical protein